ncbi:MAG: DUF1634 domain-containing protein [Chloroflexi bacterium]|nr:DUF1634 domain-containing protein [Chloroflexota bacterium]
MRDRAADTELERRVGRLITAMTRLSIGLLVIGLVLLALDGRDLLAGFEPLDLGRLSGDILAARPEPFLWLGLMVALGTPSARVAVSLVGYLRNADRLMVGVSVGILAVIATGVILAAERG